jgi:hypothetical protein
MSIDIALLLLRRSDPFYKSGILGIAKRVVYRYKDTMKLIKNPIKVINNTPAIAC